MLCLDSSVVIDILRGDAALERSIDALKDASCTTPIIACELLKSGQLNPSFRAGLEAAREYLARVEFLEFDLSACEVFGQKFAELRRSGKHIDEFDLMIASTCMAHNATLVTRNGKDFKHIEGLKLVVV